MIQLLQAEYEKFRKTGICSHPAKIGGNEGESCQICQERTAGFGYLVKHKDCLHYWFSAPGADYESCLYCQAEREKTPSLSGQPQPGGKAAN